jgi:hypothetical protein
MDILPPYIIYPINARLRSCAAIAALPLSRGTDRKNFSCGRLPLFHIALIL